MCAHTQAYGFSCGLCACIQKQSSFYGKLFLFFIQMSLFLRTYLFYFILFLLQCQQHWWQISEKEICIFIWVNLLKWGCLVMTLVLIFKLAIVFLYFPPLLFITKYLQVSAFLQWSLINCFLPDRWSDWLPCYLSAEQ